MILMPGHAAMSFSTCLKENRLLPNALDSQEELLLTEPQIDLSVLFAKGLKKDSPGPGLIIADLARRGFGLWEP